MAAVTAAAQAAADQAVLTKATSSRLYTQMTPMPGDTLAATTTAEQAYASSLTLPANSLTVGQEIHVKGAGIYSTNTLSLCTQRARLRFGGVVMIDSGPLNFPLAISSNRYMIDLRLIVRAVGTSGSVEAFGKLDFATSLTSAITLLGGPSATVGEMGNPVTVNTTQPMTLALSCQFGIVLTGNSNALRQLSVHTLRPVT